MRGLARLARKAFQFSLILAVISRYLTFAWVTPFMHVLATVGHKVSNYRKYGILRAAEDVVRAGVLSYAPGSESVHMFHLSHFHRLVSFCWFGFGCWGGFVCFAVAFFLSTDHSVRSSCQPMTSLAYLHDCHSRYDERSIVQKKKTVTIVMAQHWSKKTSACCDGLWLLLEDEVRAWLQTVVRAWACFTFSPRSLFVLGCLWDGACFLVLLFVVHDLSVVSLLSTHDNLLFGTMTATIVMMSTA